ncbi:MAG: DUF3842 family protein [Defluviitaleaceae bacterium]|nr:DUF3842 family protein [Defluviitaleaceae bacterium]
MKKIVVIDGQGGKLGRLVIEQLKAASFSSTCEIIAIGTNSIATATMLKAGADNGATGENPVIVNCRDADIIVGPIGIIATDALYGEVTAAMAVAVGSSSAHKVLMPVSRCRISIVGALPVPTAELVDMAVKQVLKRLGE